MELLLLLIWTLGFTIALFANADEDSFLWGIIRSALWPFDLLRAIWLDFKAWYDYEPPTPEGFGK